MKKVSKYQKPHPHPFYGDNYERGTDPFHVSAAPEHLKDSPAWNTGKLREGWYLLDGCGNEIGFVADGTEIEDEAGEGMKTIIEIFKIIAVSVIVVSCFPFVVAILGLLLGVLSFPIWFELIKSLWGS